MYKQFLKQQIKKRKEMEKILKSKRTVIDKRITADSVADLNKQLAELGINEKSAVCINAEVHAINREAVSESLQSAAEVQML